MACRRQPSATCSRTPSSSTSSKRPEPVLLSKLQVRPGETLSRTGWLTSPAGGEHTDRDDIVAGFIARWPNATVANVKRWFVDDPIVGDGRTWLLSNQWGRSTEAMLNALAGLVLDGSFSVVALD